MHALPFFLPSFNRRLFCFWALCVIGLRGGTSIHIRGAAVDSRLRGNGDFLRFLLHEE